jgi:uncharacterized UPF0160 family protein
MPRILLATSLLSIRAVVSSACFSLSVRQQSQGSQLAARNLRLYSSAATNMMSSNPLFKRAKLDDTAPSEKVIGTHSGTFQADEAMGCWMLLQLPLYRNSKIVRSRDLEVLGKLDIVIDVGGIYEHSKLRYDHHQRGYDERFALPRASEGNAEEPRCTKLSASGLVYRHYGKEVIRQYYPNLTEEYLDLAYVKLYDNLLEALDAIDMGVEMIPEGVTAVYKDTTGLASRVGRLNPRWNEIDEATGETPSLDARFQDAVVLCGKDFCSAMTVVVESDIPARELVERALLKRAEVCSSGQIIALESGGLPWKQHLYDLEKVHKIDPLIKFVLYQDVSGMWRVQAVTVEGRGFENRLGLPEAWRGVRDQDLEGVSKIPGSRFVHAAGFIGGADTVEGVLKMAQAALTC